MDPDLMPRLDAWAKDRQHVLADVMGRMKASDYWEVVLAQHRAGASDRVLWRLLDGAVNGGDNAAGA